MTKDMEKKQANANVHIYESILEQKFLNISSSIAAAASM